TSVFPAFGAAARATPELSTGSQNGRGGLAPSPAVGRRSRANREVTAGARLRAPGRSHHAQAFEIGRFTRRPVVALRVPELFGEGFQHPVLRLVRVAELLREPRVHVGDAERAVGRDLLAD